MNPIVRGLRGAYRSPLRSGGIALMIAVSVALILSMLAARSSIEAKIKTVQSSTANQITISPAGMQGGFGNTSTPLTTTDLTKIEKTAHVSSAYATLTDRITNSSADTSSGNFGPENSSGGTTSLTPSETFGGFGGMRAQSSGNSAEVAGPASTSQTDSNRPTPVARITVTGTDQPTKTVDSSKLTSGSMFDGSSTANVAMVGSDLASKNNLKVGDTFTAYDTSIKVVAIYKTGNTFQDNGLVMPLATLQTLSDQTGDISSITAIVDSSSNVASVTSALKSTLGSSADVTSDQAEAASLVEPLKNISTMALVGVIAATIVGAIIVLLGMTIVVRERRREIGVMKAIGASTGKIITQFSFEALTLTVIGGVIGLVMGIALAGPMTSSLASNANSTTPTSTQPGTPGQAGGIRRIGEFGTARRQLGANLTSITSTISPATIGISIAALFVIALLGSMLPSLLISNVKPAEILRSE